MLSREKTCVMMSENQSPYQTCYYTLVNKRIHEFTFFKGSTQSIDEFLDIWDSRVLPHWRDHTILTPKVLLLIDLGRANTFPPDYTIRRFKQHLAENPDVPPVRAAYLHGNILHPNLVTTRHATGQPTHPRRAKIFQGR